MKLILGLSAMLLLSSVHASESQCVTIEEAKELALSDIESLRFDMYKLSYTHASRERIRDFVGMMDFNTEENTYKTGIISRWICAPGAECYAGIKVSCDGQTSVYTFSE